jgi:dipeptidyl aminopeptidase/acylaminoacyl peptidase
MQLSKLITPIVLTAITGSAVIASPMVIKKYKASPSVAMMSPAMGDSINAVGKKFIPSTLLNAKSNIDLSQRKGCTILTAKDTLGTVDLVGSTADRQLTILETRLRPSRYMKGSLKVTSPAMFEVYKDGKSIDSKTSEEDSVSAASTKVIPLTLDAEKTSVITFKVISAGKGKNDANLIRAEFEAAKEFEDVELLVDPEMKNRFSHESTYQGLRVKSTSLSPDGKYLITRYSETYTPKNIVTHSELSDALTGKVLNANLNERVAWMPKGSKLYYSVKGENGFDVYTIDLPTMVEKLVIPNMPQDYFYWAPDESYVLYYDYSEGTKENGPLRRYTNPDDRMPGNRDRSYLMKYSIADGIASPLTYGGNTTFVQGISPDSRKVLYMTTKETPEKFPFYYSDLVELDVNTLRTDTLINQDPSMKSGIYSPDGKQVFVVGGPSFMNGLGVNCGNYPIANDYDVQGYIFDISSRTAKAATFDFNPSLTGEPIWNGGDNKIYFRAEDGFFVSIYRLDPKTLKIDKLNTQIERITNFSVGRNEDARLSYNGEGNEYAGRAYMYDLKKGTNKLIADPLSTMLGNIDFGETHTWKFTSKDGSEIDGIYCLPPNFDANKKYPMIVYYYGGTLPTLRGMSHPYVPELFASRDYVVYIPNPSGTAGYGQEFSARHINAWGDMTADEIIEGVKEFCRTHTYVNDKKVGCIGASYGGFMTQYLLTKTDIFAAAVSHAGISSVSSYWGEGYWGYSYNAVAAAESYPWTNHELFNRGSLFNADKIHTPLLLMHGTADTNVPMGESIQIFNALKILNRDVEFISVDGENHYIADLEKQQLWHASIMAWFAKWLQDDPRWWNDLYNK